MDVIQRRIFKRSLEERETYSRLYFSGSIEYYHRASPKCLTVLFGYTPPYYR